ncbi:hypothetical protein C8R44DRAFT_806974 [Mycena epipterygia]|nr:hypothetical protein C8R44DRAFT_806974 [Mycena epipterygia]
MSHPGHWGAVLTLLPSSGIAVHQHVERADDSTRSHSWQMKGTFPPVCACTVLLAHLISLWYGTIHERVGGLRT